MTKDDVFKLITSDCPQIIYLSGKTSTGKSTFCKKLVDSFGYSEVELDKIVHDSVITPFNIKDIPEAFIISYRDGEPAIWREAFIKAAKNAIHETLKKGPVIVEGAIANASTLQKVFSGAIPKPYFLYLHPTHIGDYVERITNRFINGVHDGTSALPKDFWSQLSISDIENYKLNGEQTDTLKKGIVDFAMISMEESEKRLQMLTANFPDIIIVDV